MTKDLIASFGTAGALFAPKVAPGQHLVLHVGACDYAASVWCNGQLVGGHEGGHTPFSCDLVGCVLGPAGAAGDLEIVIRAQDDADDISQPRGKQDWAAEPHGVWYPRTTGLWQPVWLELLPSRYVAAVSWRPDEERGLIGCEIILGGSPQAGERIGVHLAVGEEILADQEVAVRADRVCFEIGVGALANGVDRDRLFWAPEHPNLVHADVHLFGAGHALVDQVKSYFGIRTIGLQDGHFLLNGARIIFASSWNKEYGPRAIWPPLARRRCAMRLNS